MKPIKQKSSNRLTPEILQKAIILHLLTYQGKYYSAMGNCPRCGCKHSWKNHIDDNKIFCRLIIDSKNEEVKVKIQYFTCSNCGKVHMAIDAPFYPGANYANIIVDIVLTDQHKAYDKLLKNHINCFIHKFRNAMKKYDKKKKYPENYFKKEYEKFCKKLMKSLKKEHKELFDKKGRFTGEALTTNSIEGGNWRIKYTLKTLYSNIESIFGRTVGILIKESIYTFRNGNPNISFAHQNSNFRYANVFLT